MTLGKLLPSRASFPSRLDGPSRSFLLKNNLSVKIHRFLKVPAGTCGPFPREQRVARPSTQTTSQDIPVEPHVAQPVPLPITRTGRAPWRKRRRAPQLGSLGVRTSSEPRSPGLPPVYPELPPALPFSLLFSQNQKKNCAKSGFPFTLQRQVPKSRSATCAAAAFKASCPPARPPAAEGDAVPSPPALARRWHGTGAWVMPASQGWPSLWPGTEPTSSAERFCLPPPDTLLWANSQLFPRRTPPAGLPSPSLQHLLLPEPSETAPGPPPPGSPP